MLKHLRRLLEAHKEISSIVFNYCLSAPQLQITNMQKWDLTKAQRKQKSFKNIFSIANTAETSKCKPIDSFYTFFMLVLKRDFKDTLTCKYRQMFTAMLNENCNDLLFKS